MRLLNISTLELEEFGTPGPAYAILSHTWGKDEVSLQDLHAPGMSNLHKQGLEELRILEKHGLLYPLEAQKFDSYFKIRNHCAVASRDGFNWVWVDTCCIDKTSSAELSEAINSMYYLYQEAGDCYAYLSDVLGAEGLDFEEVFSNSRWFTRGWTLQELIAPGNITFYNRDWINVGSKHSLSENITNITGIYAAAFTS